MCVCACTHARESEEGKREGKKKESENLEICCLKKDEEKLENKIDGF